MKRLLIVASMLLIIAFIVFPVHAIQYCTDFLESGNPGGIGTCETVGTPCNSDADCFGGAFPCLNPSLKTWDDEWSMEPGQTVEIIRYTEATPAEWKIFQTNHTNQGQPGGLPG